MTDTSGCSSSMGPSSSATSAGTPVSAPTSMPPSRCVNVVDTTDSPFYVGRRSESPTSSSHGHRDAADAAITPQDHAEKATRDSSRLSTTDVRGRLMLPDWVGERAEESSSAARTVSAARPELNDGGYCRPPRHG